MRLPDIQLDDRRFQQLVSEARERVMKSCPEWTDHNVSDPGITLIELFAWMTDMLVYRLNRVPDKLHLRLLELLDIRLAPPAAAEVDVRFRLATPATESVYLPAVETEVATARTLTEEAVVFQLAETFTIPPARPTAYLVQRQGTIKDVGLTQGTARPQGADQLPFDLPPQPGDALYLGFEEALSRLLMQIPVTCSRARGAGVDPDDPPLAWEASTPQGDWVPAEVVHDTTGGFNRGSGTVELQVPAAAGAFAVDGHAGHWLRCRVLEHRRSGAIGAPYEHPPEIYSITAAPIGALLPTYHAVTEGQETLGVSDGTPGQTFRLRRAPVLPPSRAERLRVGDPQTGEWEDWELRDSFAASGPDDRHYVLDLASGEVELGPAVRTVNGAWLQHGAKPAKGSTLRFTRYRHGGGQSGNVAAGAVRVLRSSVPGVASVTNPRQALGGVDAETLDNARLRATMEYRTRHRAVTAEDYEFLCRLASPAVARAHCVPSEKPGDPVRIHLLRNVEPATKRLRWEELEPDEPLLETVGAFLDERRTAGTSIDLLPAELRGITVMVDLQVGPGADVLRIEQNVLHALNVYLNPLVGGSLQGPGTGWEFGRALNVGELYGIAQAVAGVEYVRFLRVYETDLRTETVTPTEAGRHIALRRGELIASGEHRVRAVPGSR